jgi:hypothetical protein
VNARRKEGKKNFWKMVGTHMVYLQGRRDSIKLRTKLRTAGFTTQRLYFTTALFAKVFHCRR